MELFLPIRIIYLFAVLIAVALNGFVSATRNFKPLWRWRCLSPRHYISDINLGSFDLFLLAWWV